MHLAKSAMHRPRFVACLKQQPTSPVLTLSASRITLAHCPLQGLSAQDSRGRGLAVSWLLWRGQHKVVMAAVCQEQLRQGHCTAIQR